MKDIMSRSCVRLDLCPSMCDCIALEWNHGGCMIIAEHGKYGSFRSMYSLIHADLLRFFVRDFQSDKKAHEHQAALRGWTCVLSGTCTFIGIQGIHVRAFTFKNDHGDDNVHYSTEAYFYDKKDTLIARLYFFLHPGKATYTYSPLIVETSIIGDIGRAVHDVINCRRRLAACRIQRAFLRAKYNPKYILCKRLLVRDLDNIMGIHDCKKTLKIDNMNPL